MELDHKKTGALIASIRKQKNMTQSELALRLHITDKAVSKWECGKGFPDISIIEELADQLDLSVLELIRGETFPEEQASLNEVNKLTEELISIIKEKIRSNRSRISKGILIFLPLGIAFILEALPIGIKFYVRPIPPVSVIYYSYLDLFPPLRLNLAPFICAVLTLLSMVSTVCFLHTDVASVRRRRQKISLVLLALSFASALIAAAVNKTVGSVSILIVLLIALLIQAAVFLKPTIFDQKFADHFC